MVSKVFTEDSSSPLLVFSFTEVSTSVFMTPSSQSFSQLMLASSPHSPSVTVSTIPFLDVRWYNSERVLDIGRIPSFFELRSGNRSIPRDYFKIVPSCSGGQTCKIFLAVTVAASSASYPIDTIRRRMMMTSGTGVHYKNWVDCGAQILKNEGVTSFFKGIGVNILRGTFFFILPRITPQNFTPNLTLIFRYRRCWCPLWFRSGQKELHCRENNE